MTDSRRNRLARMLARTLSQARAALYNGDGDAAAWLFAEARRLRSALEA